MFDKALEYATKRYPKEHRYMMRLWITSWKISKPISILAILIWAILGAVPAFVLGKFAGTTNIYNNIPMAAAPVPLQEIPKDDAIYQGGVLVGKVFGARRLPNDATTFEFKEITNCAQFNTTAPFRYAGVKLAFKSEQSSVGMVIGRSDGPIRFGVMAQVLE